MVFMSVKEIIAANMRAKKHCLSTVRNFGPTSTPLTSAVKNDQTDECHSLKNSRPAKSLA